MPICRRKSSIVWRIHPMLWKRYGDSASNRRVAPTRQQALAGLADSHQRRGTGRLHSHAGAPQIELVAHPCRQKILVVAEHRHELSDLVAGGKSLQKTS